LKKKLEKKTKNVLLGNEKGDSQEVVEMEFGKSKTKKLKKGWGERVYKVS